VFQGSKCVEQQNVLRKKVWVFKVCQGAKCSTEQIVPGSKMCWKANWFSKQSVPGIKMCWGAKCFEEQSKSLQSVSKSKVCVSQLSAITLFGIRPPFLIKEKINIYFLHLSILIYPAQIKVSWIVKKKTLQVKNDADFFQV
jgi:hypothetical protein